MSDKIISKEIISVFPTAVSSVFEQLANTKLVPFQGVVVGTSSLTNEGVHVSSVASLISKQFKVNVILGFPMSTFKSVMENMLGEKMTELTEEYFDGAIEILNVILGKISSCLESRFSIEWSIPTVISSTSGLHVPKSKKFVSFVLPFKLSTDGDFFLELRILAL